MPMVIRGYRDEDRVLVRDLFIRVNREIAPDALRPEFEAYIARALIEEVDRIPDYYADRNGNFWVVEDADAVVAMYGLECLDEGTAEIRRMYVDSGMRRRGFGRALLAHAGNICRETGIQILKLSTSELQGSAIAFYRACGFRLTHEEIATVWTNKTIGLGLRRFHFEWKILEGGRHESVDLNTFSARASHENT
jgi:putative acetyltransferase